MSIKTLHTFCLKLCFIVNKPNDIHCMVCEFPVLTFYLKLPPCGDLLLCSSQDVCPDWLKQTVTIITITPSWIPPKPKTRKWTAAFQIWTLLQRSSGLKPRGTKYQVSDLRPPKSNQFTGVSKWMHSTVNASKRTGQATPKPLYTAVINTVA